MAPKREIVESGGRYPERKYGHLIAKPPNQHHQELVKGCLAKFKKPITAAQIAREIGPWMTPGDVMDALKGLENEILITPRKRGPPAVQLKRRPAGQNQHP